MAPSSNKETPASENTHLDPVLYSKFVKLRARLKDRVDYMELDNLQHETPRVLNGDLCMPALLKKWSGNKKVIQLPANYEAAGS